MSGADVSFRDQDQGRSAATATQRVRAAARSLGFDAVGIARADVPLGVDWARYNAFVDAGMHGEMGFLAQNRDARARLDTSAILEGAKSVICVARRYGPPATTESAPESGITGMIARYARGQDYHKFLRKRIRRLAVMVRALGSPSAPVRARPLCDEEPVLERAWAARAGLGFVGKNGLLIVPGLGSMVMLGEVVTTLDLAPDEPMAERCGTCTRCLDACPTQAFARPFVLDARRCIAYLTIEHRSAVPEELAPAVASHLFGCDDGQTACPVNAGPTRRPVARTHDREPFAPLERWPRTRLESLLALTETEWAALSEGTPLRRLGRARLARNAAIVLGNRGDVDALPALYVTSEAHEDAAVRSAAGWAIKRMGRLPASPARE